LVVDFTPPFPAQAGNRSLTSLAGPHFSPSSRRGRNWPTFRLAPIAGRDPALKSDRGHIDGVAGAHGAERRRGIAAPNMDRSEILWGFSCGLKPLSHAHLPVDAERYAARTRPRGRAQGEDPRHHRRHAGMPLAPAPTRRGAPPTPTGRWSSSFVIEPEAPRVFSEWREIMRAEAREQAQATLAKFAGRGPRSRQPGPGDGHSRRKAGRTDPRLD
jgi:hypothetical protein